MIRGWRSALAERRDRRALERQLATQARKARRIDPRERFVWMAARTHEVWDRIRALGPLPAEPRVLEVGSGAHGLIFCSESEYRVGVDPLAHHYRGLFPWWQDRAPTLSAAGEALPFPDACFDVVLCDNVVDHVSRPELILAEIVRVMRPGALLYFTVDVHHPIYGAASRLYGLARMAGIPVEISPFASHPVHLNRRRARHLFAGQPLELVADRLYREAALQHARKMPMRHAGDLFKRVFFKNASWEVFARRAPDRTD